MNSNRRSKQLSSLEIERELSQLCNIEEDDSGDESGNELSVTHCDNEDEDFQLDQESSTSEDSEADIPTKSHFDSETQDSNLHSERGIRRSRGRRPGSSGRAVHSGSITRGGRQVRTSSLPEIDWFNGYGCQVSKQHPFYRTSSNEYGWYPPGYYSVPSVFFPAGQTFTNRLSAAGMYRNYSLNTGMDQIGYP